MARLRVVRSCVTALRLTVPSSPVRGTSSSIPERRLRLRSTYSTTAAPPGVRVQRFDASVICQRRLHILGLWRHRGGNARYDESGDVLLARRTRCQLPRPEPLQLVNVLWSG